jgi:hypothetical protein
MQSLRADIFGIANISIYLYDTIDAAGNRLRSILRDRRATEAPGCKQITYRLRVFVAVVFSFYEP